MKNKTLLILAAGMGSRFGGLKQMEAVGPNGEFIIDYSIYDAIRCGFNKIVFIIKKENHQIFLDTIGNRIENKVKDFNIEVKYVYQDFSLIKDKTKMPLNRVSPLGTGYAVLCAKDVINEPFLIINSDDFYGYDGFKQASNYIDTFDNKSLGIVGYKVFNTLTKHGSLKRGICKLKDGKFDRIVECKLVNEEGNINAYPLECGDMFTLDEGDLASINLNVFYPGFFEYLDKKLDHFVETADLENDELFITHAMTDAYNDGVCNVDVITTDAKWAGITFKEDKEDVVSYINGLIENNEYPSDLWK